MCRQKKWFTHLNRTVICLSNISSLWFNFSTRYIDAFHWLRFSGKTGMTDVIKYFQIFSKIDRYFDILDHNLLLEKLEHYKFSPTALLWIKSYLNERQQTVLMEASQNPHKLSVGYPKEVPLGLTCTRFLQMFFH